MVETMVTPVCWGLAFQSQMLQPLLDLTKSVWRCVWETARISANPSWCWAAILSWKGNPVTQWWIEAATQIWKCWRQGRARHVLKELWLMQEDKKDKGIWTVFTRFLSDCGAQRNQIGVVSIQGARVLDVNMSLAHWRHAARGLARNWWALRSGIPHSEVLRINWKLIDSMLGKPKMVRSSIATMMSGGFLTAAVQNTIFADASGSCPRCGGWDSQIHRLYWCEASEGKRREVRLRPQEVVRALTDGTTWAAKGILLREANMQRSYPARCLGTSFLELVGPSIPDEDAILGFEGEICRFGVEAKEWKGPTSVVSVVLMGQQNHAVHEVTGMSAKTGTFAGALRLMLGCCVRRKRCVICCAYSFQAFREWIRDPNSPWDEIRGHILDSEWSGLNGK